ncbi:MAG: hypothetical protein KDB94_03230, partial [Acidobacteria bacterium]|nr:hypothetical protein [Acidobacteriota bacterium]
KVLKQTWKGEALPFHARAQLGLLAAQVGDAEVLAEHALAALGWLQAQHRLPEAARHARAAVSALDAAGHEPEVRLLLLGADEVARQGEVELTMRWLKRAEEGCGADR